MNFGHPAFLFPLAAGLEGEPRWLQAPRRGGQRVLPIILSAAAPRARRGRCRHRLLQGIESTDQAGSPASDPRCNGPSVFGRKQEGSEFRRGQAGLGGSLTKPDVDYIGQALSSGVHRPFPPVQPGNPPQW